MRYIQRIDDQPFEVQSDEVTRWTCCDCGLVHDIAFVARGDTIGVAARVNKRATAARRRHMTETPTPAAARERSAHSSPRQVEREGSRDTENPLPHTPERSES